MSTPLKFGKNKVMFGKLVWFSFLFKVNFSIFMKDWNTKTQYSILYISFPRKITIEEIAMSIEEQWSEFCVHLILNLVKKRNGIKIIKRFHKILHFEIENK